jgi:uncharacterized ferritin-like protein (DUF455 family)
MKLSDFTDKILLGGDLNDKLFFPKEIQFDDVLGQKIEIPQRYGKIKFSVKQARFPKGNFHETKRTVMALHAFANHELLAVEIMAHALSIFPHNTDEEKRFKRGILSALKDEQKHFKLYANRIKQLGYEFGDFPLNDFFWKHMKDMNSPQEYLSMMAMTFEAANLDFSFQYEKIFRDLGDVVTADIMKIVYEDEISHVGFGVNYLNKWKEDKTLWEYYRICLPFPLTPARARGKSFDENSRIRAKMDNDFISNLLNYKDDYKVTARKEWK